MPTRKEKDIRTISKTKSGSYFVTIPVELIRELSLRKGQKVRVNKYGKGLIIKDWKPSKKRKK